MLNNLKNEAYKTRLTAQEKAAMKAAVFGAPSSVRMHQSPYVFLPLRFVVPSVLVLVVLVGGSTVSAAAGALPGDLLYPIKISINERIEAAAAPTVEAKAEVLARQAERRVEEAQALAVEGKLDAETSAALGASFEAQAAQAEMLAEAADKKQDGDGVSVRVRLAAALKVKGQILEMLGEGKDQKTKEESGALAARVIARAEGPAPVAAMRSFATAAPTAKSFAPAPAPEAAPQDTGISAMLGGDTEVAPAVSAIDEKAYKAAARLEKKAAEALAKTTERFTEAQNLDATTTKRIKQIITDAEENMNDGKVLLEGHTYEIASGKFQDVLVAMTRLEALLKAEQKFDRNLIRRLLER